MRNQVFKKLFSVLLALIMVAGLLPASVLAEGEGNADSTPAPTEAVQPTESAEPTAPIETETPEVTEVPEPTPENPATTVEPTQGEPTAEPTDEGIMPANVMPVQANVELQYRIVHLDCGREYFTKDWIIALINEMADAGYNQLQLAFGNGGFRFYLDDMAIGSHSSDDVKNALEAGNVHYNTYGDSENGPTNQEWITYNPSKNALTETEMNAIIEHARSKGIEIVPMLNTPGHMHAVLAAMNQLSIAGDLQVSGKHGCLNLSDSNIEAVAFTKALVEKYVDYFASRGCKFFNFAMDEYSSFDTSFFTYANYLIAYANTNGITPRVFNDALSHGITNNGFIEGTQVCCWDSIQNTGSYSVINTSHDFYYVSTNENWNLYREGYTFVGEYAEATWIEHAKKFDNNVFLYKKVSSKINPVGSMFCIWCNTPGKNNETEIAQQIRMILRVIGARMQNSDIYSASDVLVEGGFKADGTINVPTNNKTVGNGSGNTTADNDTVRVTGPNLAALTAPEHTGEIAGIEAVEGRIMAYDVTPSTADNNKYTGEAEVRIKIPEGWDKTKVKAFIVEDGTAKDIDGTATEDGWYVFTAPHFSVMGIYEQAVTYVEKTVTVAVGDSETVTIEGYDYSEQVGEIDTSIATVKVTYEGVTVSEFTPATSISNNAKYIVKYGDKYIDENGKLTDNISEAAEWTYERYNNTYGKLKNSKDQYLTYQSNGSFTTVQGYNNNSWLYVNGTTVNMHDGSGYNIALSLGTKTEGSSQPSTIITFTGVKEGTTSVVIGGTRYTVKVVDATLAQQVLPINLWITNTGVVPDGWGTSYNKVTREGFTYGLDTEHINNGWETFRAIYELKATEDSIHSEQGAKLSELIPNTGKAYGYRGGNTPEEYNVDIWKCSYNASAERQSTDGWTNSSNKGTEFEYIRYWDNKWEYCSAKTGEWTEVGEVGAGKDDSAKNQVCVWYRQVTTVTSEVTTEIVDWGPIQYGANQCLLDFAVKYDGTAGRIPDSFPVTGKTIGFDCPTDQTVPLGNGYVVQDTDGTYYRTVYGIAGVETSNYEVYMITVTPTSDTHTDSVTNGTKPTESNGYTYGGTDGGTEKIAWAKTEADANSAELYKMPNVKYGGEPFLESVKIYRYQGLLVTYYLRAKETTESLSVHYAIDGTNVEFHKYNIIVKANADGTYPTFDENIGLNQTNKKGPLDHGTIVNSNNVTITVSSDLSTLNNLEPQYRYSDYDVERSERKDPKNVWIYYTFKREHTYVIDFGLPLKIKFSDFGVTNDAAIETVSLWKEETVLENKGLYGTAKVITDGTEGKYVLYTLDKPLDKNITIPLYVKFSQKGDNDKPQLFTANIIPATNVYYEDSFAKFTNGSYVDGESNSQEIKWGNEGTSTEANATQALEALGTKENVYGYDPAYKNSTMFSMGSARKVTVTSDMATNWNNNTSAWPTAQFTFKGTGFDIISLTDNTSGAIFVFVYEGKDTTGKLENAYMVDNYYGYMQQEDGSWVVDKTSKNALYQIPVMRIRKLTYGEHTVVVRVFYDNAFDSTEGQTSYSFWLDAVRVYDPMGANDDTYTQDKEGYPQYIKLRSELKKLNKDGSADKGALFIDGNENATIKEYYNLGPNNEVYLAKGQAITFKLGEENGLANIATVQIGAKAPTGATNLTVNGNVVLVEGLGTATEMYYDITKQVIGDAGENAAANVVTITNNTGNILSLTNLKITFSTKPVSDVAFDQLSLGDQENALAVVRALFAPVPVEPEPEPEPEKTFEPERFEASWSRNVMQGRKATLTVKTSEDVEAITVDGQTIRSYRTRTERVGFGRRAKRITYREFNYSMVAQESADFSVTAINAEGTESEAITARLTVKTRPNSMRDMWDWFKGWF